MKITQSIHHRIRLKNWLITLALILLMATLAWLSVRYNSQIDITANKGHSLSIKSQQILDALPGEVLITAYIKNEQPIRLQIAQLIDRYSEYKKDLHLVFVDPEAQPEKIRELNIGATGAIVVQYKDRSEQITYLSESSLTNALQHLAFAKPRWLSFLSGHGERSPHGAANFDYSIFSQSLRKRGIRSEKINLARNPHIPDNSDLLIIATPKVNLLPGEKDIILKHILQGGHLLWLMEPDNITFPELSDLLGVNALPGTLLDKSNQLFGIDDPRFILIGDYGDHPVAQGFKTISLFPISAALSISDETDFNNEVLLQTNDQAWTELGAINKHSQYDADSDEQTGALALAFALTRKLGEHQQRIIVVGDADFLSNAYIGNVGNTDLGLRMINWLTHEDQFIQIANKAAPDSSLQLSSTAIIIIGFGFLIVIPLAFVIAGIIIWRKRKRS